MARVIYILDDERNAVELMTRIVSDLAPDAEISSFQSPVEALLRAQTVIPDIVFSDINMPGMTGLEVAEKFKKINPKVNIIFVTGYDNYVMPAMDLHCSGYIMKPVSKKKVQEKLNNLLYPIEKARSGIYARTFGSFDLLKDGVAVKFKREKSKELLALLIDKNGASVSNRWIASYLFPEKNYDTSVKNNITTIISELRASLREVGAEDIIIKEWGSIQLDKTKLSCDLFDYLADSIDIRDTFRGVYMEQYSWAEETQSMLFWKEESKNL